MQQSDYTAFLTLVGGVHDFYGKELSPFAAGIWWEACKSSELAEVSQAFSDHLMDAESGKWLPKPADLVKQLRGTRADQSRLAWAKVLDAAQRVGAYSDVVFDDPIIHACIEDLGGWVIVCRTGYDELPHLERRFCDAYKAYSMPGRLAKWPTRLAGESNVVNRLRGHVAPAPVLIGDQAKCQRVMREGRDEPRAQITHVADALRLSRENTYPQSRA